mgnify:CR=1 FL=1
MTHAQFSQLQIALQLLSQADALVQQAMGAGDECYAIHNAIEDVEDMVSDVIREADERGEINPA